MNTQRRTEFIAEGLSIIIRSARSLMAAAKSLSAYPREAEILQGHALEECAKLLILIDVVRCPPNIVAARLGLMMKWFYQHLPRLIYADAQGWIAYSPSMLQSYVDNERTSHYLEGENGEYILPNSRLFHRESTLYADVAGDEDAEPSWISPLRGARFDFRPIYPAAYRIAEALDAVGGLTLQGLKIMASVWGEIDFSREQPAWSDPRPVNCVMLTKLIAANLATPRAEEQHFNTLVGSWQKPMYSIDFSLRQVSLEELQRLREGIVWDDSCY